MKTSKFLLLSLFILASTANADVVVNKWGTTKLDENAVHLMTQRLTEVYGNQIQEKFKQDVSFKFTFGKYLDAGVNPYRKNGILIKMAIPNQFTEPQVLAVLCHEIGHLVSKGKKLNWLSLTKTVATEGQSDYFAAHCMRDYMVKFSEIENYLEQLEKIDQDVLTVCQNNKLKKFKADQCKVILQGFKLTFQDLDPKTTGYDTEMDKKALATDRMHPETQCRLDTIKNAVLGKGRDRCWYNPIIPTMPEIGDFPIFE